MKIDKFELAGNCPFCNGQVVFTTNDKLYGKKYGNGMCYMCMNCKASVGCHKNGEPLGLLANKKMKKLKMECHSLFDPIWKSRKASRSALYKKLAKSLEIRVENCHFGHFDTPKLNEALKVLRTPNWYKD